MKVGLFRVWFFKVMVFSSHCSSMVSASWLVGIRWLVSMWASMSPVRPLFVCMVFTCLSHMVLMASMGFVPWRVSWMSVVMGSPMGCPCSVVTRAPISSSAWLLGFMPVVSTSTHTIIFVFSLFVFMVASLSACRVIY